MHSPATPAHPRCWPEASPVPRTTPPVGISDGADSVAKGKKRATGAGANGIERTLQTALRRDQIKTMPRFAATVANTKSDRYDNQTVFDRLDRAVATNEKVTIIESAGYSERTA